MVKSEEPVRKLIEVTFMSLDGVIDAPDIVQEAKPYILSSEEHIAYQKSRLFAADTLLLGRKTYEKLSKAYVDMANAGQGAPMDIVDRMNSVPKYVASRTRKEAPGMPLLSMETSQNKCGRLRINQAKI